MSQHSENEFAEKLRAAEKMIDSITAWMRHEAIQRVQNRSHGDMGSMIRWRDGMPQFSKVRSSNTIKPKGIAKLPAEKVDGSA